MDYLSAFYQGKALFSLSSTNNDNGGKGNGNGNGNGNSKGNYNIKRIVERAWNETKQESIKQRIVFIDNIPSVHKDKKKDFCSFLSNYLDEMCCVVKGSLFVSLDESTLHTNPWCFVEFAAEEKIREVANQLKKNKLKLPSHLVGSGGAGAGAGAGAGGGGKSKKEKKEQQQLLPSQIKSFVELEKVHDKHLVEYLRSLLFDSSTRTLTADCHQLLTEVFNRYAEGSPEPLLTGPAMDRLQKDSTGKPFGPENIAYALEMFESKTTEVAVVPVETPEDAGSMPMDVDKVSLQLQGITLKGFLQLYTIQCEKEPIETFDEFLMLGYDMHLLRNNYLTPEEALQEIEAAQQQQRQRRQQQEKEKSLLAIDEEIVRYAQSVFTDLREFNTPAMLKPCHIMPITDDPNDLKWKPSSITYLTLKMLTKLNVPQLRLRYEILRQFNARLITVLPFLNLSDRCSQVVRFVLQHNNIIFYSIKMEFFYDVLDKTSVSVSQQPAVRYNRLKLAARQEKRDPHAQLTDELILKNTTFGIAFSQLRKTNPSLFRPKKPTGTEPHVAVLIQFKGEHVQGEGGPYRQFFTDISRELRDSTCLPLFIPSPNAQGKVGEGRDKFVIAPSTKSKLHLRMFRFLGHLMGMSIRTGVLLTIDLPSFFWKPLVGAPLTVSDLEAIDHHFYTTMRFFRESTSEQFAVFQRFEIPLSDKSTFVLIKDGDKIDVTYENKELYVRLAEAARLNESKAQLKEIRRGLTDVVPQHLLGLLSWQDLELRVCGKPKIDFKLLKRHTVYNLVSPTAAHIIYFWEVLESLNDEDRRAFVRFVWGQERLPATDQEFKRTATRMLIKPYTGTAAPDRAFPRADTCFFNLFLPEYTSPEKLRDKLLLACHFDADSMNADQVPLEDDSAMAATAAAAAAAAAAVVGGHPGSGLPSFLFQ